VVAIAVVYTSLFFRVVRGSVLAESAQSYVEAAEALGRGRLGILFRHILPNVISPIVIQTAVCLSYGILIGSALSYLGVGVQPPTPSWGTILNDGKEFLTLAPWVSLFPGAFIMLGDGLRDGLDPAGQVFADPRVQVHEDGIPLIASCSGSVGRAGA
jgi:peptide/nickel transport system permease protein